MKSPIRILLVDDDLNLLQTLSDYLKHRLLSIVYMAHSAPEAFAQFDLNGPFDLVISDFQMTPHSAYDIEDSLRRKQGKTPLIVHSSLTDIDESRFHPDHFMGLVPKPGHRELFDLIAERFTYAKKT